MRFASPRTSATSARNAARAFTARRAAASVRAVRASVRPDATRVVRRMRVGRHASIVSTPNVTATAAGRTASAAPPGPSAARSAAPQVPAAAGGRTARRAHVAATVRR
jgi:hypothetical protein